jgi:hypothetical protein
MQRIIEIKKMLGVVLGIVVFAATTYADTYNTFKTTWYYSANRQYVVEVTTKRRATLYHKNHRLQRVWTRTLRALPDRLLVANDGGRVAIVDRYYGNANNPNMPAVIFLDESGNEMVSYALKEVADLSRVIRTTSQAQWYRDVNFTPDENVLVIETVIAKREPSKCGVVESPEEAEECSKSVPFERLRFASASGKLISRTDEYSGRNQRN